MIIILKEPVVFRVTNTDSLEIPAGAYKAIRHKYISDYGQIIIDRPMTNEEFEEKCNKLQLFVVYHKRRYFAIRRELCEVPKIWQGWFNF